MKKTLSILGGLCAVAAMLIPSGAMSAPQGGRINMGKLTILPGLEGNVEYDDNIFMGSGNGPGEEKRSDFMFQEIPSVHFVYQMPERGSIDLGLEGTFSQYGQYNSNNWNAGQVSFLGDYDAPGGLILGISEVYLNTEDPYGSQDQFNVGTKTQRWTNTLDLKAGYNLSSNFRAMILYDGYKQHFKEDIDKSQNYNEDIVGVGGAMRVMPKTWAFARYYYANRNFNDSINDNTNADVKGSRGEFGLNWDSGSKFSGELNLGVQQLNFDNDLDAAGLKYEDKTLFVARTNVNFQLDEATMITGTLTRSPRPASADTSVYFKETLVGIFANHTFMTKYTAFTDFNYSKDNYTTDRDDDNYAFKLGMEYDLRKWLALRATYDYYKKDSNYADEEYTDNRVLLGITGVY